MSEHQYVIHPGYPAPDIGPFSTADAAAAYVAEHEVRPSSIRVVVSPEAWTAGQA